MAARRSRSYLWRTNGVSCRLILLIGLAGSLLSLTTGYSKSWLKPQRNSTGYREARLLHGEPMLTIICRRKSFLMCTRGRLTNSIRTPKSVVISKGLLSGTSCGGPPEKDRQESGEEYDVIRKRHGKQSMDWCHVVTRLSKIATAKDPSFRRRTLVWRCNIFAAFLSHCARNENESMVKYLQLNAAAPKNRALFDCSARAYHEHEWLDKRLDRHLERKVEILECSNLKHTSEPS